jgi:ferrous iron transport protein A
MSHAASSKPPIDIDRKEPAALDLTCLADGESARVVGLRGGGEASRRLEALGIGIGSVISKKSSALRRGPIVVERGRAQVALGFELARGILVEPIA